MSEYIDPDYESEFAAPPYSILERFVRDGHIVTVVLMEGEVCQFEVPVAVHEIGKCAVVPLGQRFQEIVNRLEG